MITIYADVLIILNIYVNFFLLRTTAKITHSPLKNIRCAAASLYGSLFSLTIFLPELPPYVNIAVKLIAAVTVVAAAFGIENIRRTVINTASFFTANFVLAGAVYGIYTWFEPDFVHFNNTYFYIDFSLLILIISTALMYLAVHFFRMIFDRDTIGDYMIIIRCGKKLVTVRGLADTGNVLTDFFTGCPVIICDSELYTTITGQNISYNSLPKGYRVLPCSTVSENGLIPIFRPDEILIVNKTDKTRKKVDALVGFGNTSGDAVFNPKLLIN